jgi:hypothetical protein
LGEGDKSFLDFAPPLLSGRGDWGGEGNLHST